MPKHRIEALEAVSELAKRSEQRIRDLNVEAIIISRKIEHEREVLKDIEHYRDWLERNNPEEARPC